MNAANFMNVPGCYLEIRQDSLQVLAGEQGLELPLERQADGRLTAACKERVALRFQELLKKRAPWQRPRVVCAIGARGVTLRQFSLPATNGDELSRVLRLQMETELPLSPDELAWGYIPLREGESAGAGPAKQEVLVAAVKRETLEEYTELLNACGASPVFTLAAWARSFLCAQPPATYTVIEVGGKYSELTIFQNHVPIALRLLTWGADDITRSVEQAMGVGRVEAEKLRKDSEQGRSDGESALAGQWQAAAQRLAALCDGQTVGTKVYVSGAGAQRLAPPLGNRLGVRCEALPAASGPGRTAAVLGLKQADAASRRYVVLQVQPTNGNAVAARPAPWKWAALAVILALAAFFLPHLEAMLFKPDLVKRLAAIKSDQGRLEVIDRELLFLKHLKQQQPPYLEALYVMAKSAPPGARLDSLSMNRRGEVSLRGNMQNGQQLTDFRTKLIDSGFFANVAVEEQNPTPDRQKINIRMSAQWKPAGAREAVSPPAQPEKDKPGDKAATPGSKPGTGSTSAMAEARGPAGATSAPPIAPGTSAPPTAADQKLKRAGETNGIPDGTNKPAPVLPNTKG